MGFPGDDATQIGTNGRRRELKVSLPGGISFSFRGFDVVLMVVAACMPLMTYFIWSLMVSSQKEHSELTEAIEVQTYVLTLPQNKRESLDLAMPESVKRRTVEERRRIREARRLRELEDRNDR